MLIRMRTMGQSHIGLCVRSDAQYSETSSSAESHARVVAQVFYPVRRSLKGVMFLSVSVCLSVCLSVDMMECWTFLEDYGT